MTSPSTLLLQGVEVPFELGLIASIGFLIMNIALCKLPLNYIETTNSMLNLKIKITLTKKNVVHRSIELKP